ncbi:hypothetical protein JW756_04145 [Candidatus Woesearchaeota archaeon]|nr:hypothetical protein [Candidatus Woesearchaeota archaeon]
MRVIYYKKEKDSKINYYSNWFEDYFYIPDFKLLLFKHTPIIWGKPEFRLSSDPELLKEVITHIKRKNPYRDGEIVFSKPKKLIYSTP